MSQEHESQNWWGNSGKAFCLGLTTLLFASFFGYEALSESDIDVGAGAIASGVGGLSAFFFWVALHDERKAAVKEFHKTGSK